MILFFSPSEWKREKGGSESCFRGLSRPGGVPHSGGVPEAAVATRDLQLGTLAEPQAQGRLWSRAERAGPGRGRGGKGRGLCGEGMLGPAWRAAGRAQPPPLTADQADQAVPFLAAGDRLRSLPSAGRRDGAGEGRGWEGRRVGHLLGKDHRAWPLPCFSQGWGVLS